MYVCMYVCVYMHVYIHVIHPVVHMMYGIVYILARDQARERGHHDTVLQIYLVDCVHVVVHGLSVMLSMTTTCYNCHLLAFDFLHVATVIKLRSLHAWPLSATDA